MSYQIEKLKSEDFENFANLFVDYFVNDMKVIFDRDKLKENLVRNTILKQYRENIIYIDLIKKEDILGFIIYQIDNINSNWQERLGQGFIREFCILKEYRNKGLGSMLLNHAESTLKNLGVKQIYLTSDENEKVKNFYLKNGYKTNYQRNKTNNNEIFEKTL